jgi:hypothetical protein
MTLYRMRPDSYGCSRLQKQAWRLKHFQPKRRKSAIARDAVSPNLLSWLIVEVSMKPLRSFICTTLISLATTVLIPAAPFALAQEQTESRHVPGAEIARNEQRFLIESDLAISKMSLGMTAEATGDVDRDFIAMMNAHQQGAIDIAAAELKYGHNEELRRFAGDMIAAREQEISVMRHPFEGPAPAQTNDTPLGKPTSGRAPSPKSREK